MICHDDDYTRVITYWMRSETLKSLTPRKVK
jgi:hypothetical protein